MEGLTYALKCLAAHVWATEPDAKGHIFVYRNCEGCGCAMFRGKVMGLAERHLNDRAILKRILAK